MRAVVDIGSNSVKFTVAEIQRGVPRPLDRGSWVTRLSRNLEKTGLLAAESVAETEKVLIEIARRVAQFPGAQVRVVATSAVRDCKNPEEIASRVRKLLGVELRVLKGSEEAEISLRGAAAATRLRRGSTAGIFVDVGGASTEVGMLEPSPSTHSFQAGAVRSHERLGLAQMPVSDEVWAQAAADMPGFFPDALLRPFTAAAKKCTAVGGSILVASRLAGARPAPEVEGASLGYDLRRSDLEAFNDTFRKLSLEDRLKYPKVEAGRADVMCAGILCLTYVMKHLDIDELFVTEWGLRHGLLLGDASK